MLGVWYTHYSMPLVSRFKPQYIGLVVVGLFLIVGAAVGYLWLRKNVPPAIDTMPEPPVSLWHSALTGLPVGSEAEEHPQVVGIMFDNHADARPQSGLDKASIVYEAPVEGGITRFFGIFSASTTALKVGPVRSARPYFLDWLQEYGDAMYMHSGGSPEALRLIGARDLFDANEFYRGAYYWRDASRFAPHNLYSSSANWQKMIVKYGADRTALPWEGWKFADETTQARTATSPVSVMVAYASTYKVTWQFTAATGRYARLLNAQPYTTQEGVPIIADSVVFLSMNVATIDDEGRREIQTVGSGDATILTGGNLIRGTWRKNGLTDRTRWYDAEGAEITLVSGVTWVQIVPSEIGLTIESKDS